MIKTKNCKHGKFTFFENDTVIGKSMNLYGEYCEWEIMCLEHIIEPSWHILDIGANIGTHTIPFSKMVYRGHVYAFEPNEFSRKLLETNLLDNKVGNVTSFPYAISRGNGKAYIGNYNVAIPGNYGEVSILDSAENMQLIDTMRLDAIKFERVDLIKMDIEGSEPEALKGAKHTLAKYLPTCFIECNKTENLQHLFIRFKKLGYHKMYWCPVRNYNPDNFYGYNKNVFGSSGVINLLMISPNLNVNFDYLEPIIDETDTYQKMYKRVSNNHKTAKLL
jgi:FkbM family methyltransferase